MALSGIRVVDLTRVLAGPYCTMLLADMGAEVLKVESPKGGDPVRAQGTIRDGLSWYFAAFNRNKRSLAIDLRQDEGRHLLEALLRSADVLVENFRPGVLDAMGLGRERLEALNPGLVVAGISGFGADGPHARRPSVDFVAQAMSGFMSVNGKDGEDPIRAALPLSDLIAGLQAAFGIVCALIERGRSGRGQRVDTNLLSAMISQHAYMASELFASGRVPRRTGNDHPLVAPYGLFHAKDGEVAIAPSNDVLLRRLFEALGIPEILDDPRFDSNDKRVARRAEINAIVDSRLAHDTQAAWIERLAAAGVPCGRVMPLEEVFDDPQVQAQEMAVEIDHPGHGPVRMLGFPIRLDRTPCTARKPAPRLGEDTGAVLAELGLDGARIADLRARGVIG